MSIEGLPPPVRFTVSIIDRWTCEYEAQRVPPELPQLGTTQYTLEAIRQLPLILSSDK